jgi:integrase
MVYKEKAQFTYLFSTFKNKEHFMESVSAIRVMNSVLREAMAQNTNLKNIKSHSFRISFITRLIEAHSLLAASQIIGHKNLSTTALYSRFDVFKPGAKLAEFTIPGFQNLVDKVNQKESYELIVKENNRGIHTL